MLVCAQMRSSLPKVLLDVSQCSHTQCATHNAQENGTKMLWVPIGYPKQINGEMLIYRLSLDTGINMLHDMVARLTGAE